MDVSRDEAIILEDSAHGVLAADKAGIKVILIPDLVDPPPEIEKLVYKKLNSLNGLKDLLN